MYIIIFDNFINIFFFFFFFFNIYNIIFYKILLLLLLLFYKPAAFASVGLYFGIVNVFVFGCGALFGLWLLTRCATYTGRNSSFFSLSMITFPQASVFFDLAISIKCFGVSVSYLIIIGDLVNIKTKKKKIFFYYNLFINSYI